MEEEKAGANSELRYLALELTKIAVKGKRPFKAVATEYVQNVYELQNVLKGGSRVSRSSGIKNPVRGIEQQKKR